MVSLFERLERARAPGDASPDAGPRDALADSVLASVRSLLNARQGCCETRIDYGMPDLNDVSREASETVPALARAVKRQLDLFEPRLTQVQVRPLPVGDTPGEFAFAVSAVLRTGDEDAPLRFDTVLGNDRQMRLRE